MEYGVDVTMVTYIETRRIRCRLVRRVTSFVVHPDEPFFELLKVLEIGQNNTRL